MELAQAASRCSVACASRRLKLLQIRRAALDRPSRHRTSPEQMPARPNSACSVGISPTQAVTQSASPTPHLRPCPGALGHSIRLRTARRPCFWSLDLSSRQHRLLERRENNTISIPNVVSGSPPDVRAHSPPPPHGQRCTPECRWRGRISTAGTVVTGHRQSPVHVIRGDAAAGAGPVPAPAWPAVVSATRRTKYRPRRSLPGEPPHRLTGRSRCRQPGCTQARSNRLCGDRALPGTPGWYPKQQSSLVVAQPERAPPFLPDQEGRAARN